MSENLEKIPEHIAIIMDGNGRWAKARGFPRIIGHKNGAKATKDVILNADELGVKYLSLYAFSSENWARPEKEVQFLMALMTEMIDREVEVMMENNVKLNVIGRMQTLPELFRNKLLNGMERTKNNTGLNLILCISYGGRQEIVDSVTRIAEKVKEGKLSVGDLSEDLINDHLYLPHVPHPELVVRTSGEMRVSNYLLWQIAYSEFFVTEKLWPDFDMEELKKAITFYNSVQRKFGKVIE